MGKLERAEVKEIGVETEKLGDIDFAVDVLEEREAPEVEVVVDRMGANGGRRGGMSHNDWRILYECYVESRQKVNGGMKTTGRDC